MEITIIRGVQIKGNSVTQVFNDLKEWLDFYKVSELLGIEKETYDFNTLFLSKKRITRSAEIFPDEKFSNEELLHEYYGEVLESFKMKHGYVILQYKELNDKNKYNLVFGRMLYNKFTQYDCEVSPVLAPIDIFAGIGEDRTYMIINVEQ